jgi:hypothetical protein
MDARKSQRNLIEYSGLGVCSRLTLYFNLFVGNCFSSANVLLEARACFFMYITNKGDQNLEVKHPREKNLLVSTSVVVLNNFNDKTK